MKRLISLLMIMILALPVSALAAVPAAAASDFQIQDGVLLRYTGNAAEVTVPDGVYCIGASAFEGNKELKKIMLPDDVCEIGDRAFCNCTALSTVNGDAVSSVGVFAFSGTPYFEKSSDEFFRLGSCLLWYNGTAQNVILPYGIDSIAPYAFLRCETLSAFSAPEGLVSVGEGAFYGCGSLTEVSLPGSVSYIGGDAFTHTAFLDQSSGYVILGDGVLVRYSGSEAVLQVPSNVRRIGAGAFAGNTAITEAVIPRTVYAVDRDAFAGCKRLTKLTLSRGLVYIGDGAFSGCAALRELTTPESLTYIGSRAFADCTVLQHIGLCGTGLTVAPEAFAGSSAMRYALFSAGVSAVSDRAFNGCSSLGGVSIPAGELMIGAAAFEGCQRLTVFCAEDASAVQSLSSLTISNAKGDADGDGMVSILDATRIQRFLADLTTMDYCAMCAGEMDEDAMITILDATFIQRLLADMV